MSNTRMEVPCLVPGVVSMVDLDFEGDNNIALYALTFPRLGPFPYTTATVLDNLSRSDVSWVPWSDRHFFAGLVEGD